MIFKRKLSASTGWKRTNIVATATAWDLIHTWLTKASDFEQIFLWADNSAESAVVLSIEFGDAVKPIEVSLAANSGLVKVVDWLILQGASTPYTIKAFAWTTAVVSIGWYVERNVA